MHETAVANASPLIYLIRVGRVDLLQLAAPQIAVPSPVARELSPPGTADPSAKVLTTTSWITVVEPPLTPSSVLAWDLGPGESSVLAWALSHPGSLALFDDLAARRCAAAHRVPVRGTLGLVLLAKQQGRIASARQLLDSLRGAGMWLSDRVVNEALTLVGE